MNLRITNLVHLSMAVLLIVGISGCTDSNSGSKSGILGSISKSSVSSKMASAESSGIFSEKADTMSYGQCGGKIESYYATYNNGDTLSIMWDNIRPPCDNKVKIVRFDFKQRSSEGHDISYAYVLSYKNALGKPDQPDQYKGPSGNIYWTMDGRVDPANSNGDINEANDFIKIGNEKANEIVRRYESGQLK